jgi:hypothetical protein
MSMPWVFCWLTLDPPWVFNPPALRKMCASMKQPNKRSFCIIMVILNTLLHLNLTQHSSPYWWFFFLSIVFNPKLLESFEALNDFFFHLGA